MSPVAAGVTGVVVSLDSAGCLDAAACGDKAARLARARASGFPVLPGFVVPTTASQEVLAVAAGRCAGNPYAARLAVMDWDTAALAPVAAAARALSAPVVVRSSSPVEGSGRWAGAFASYVGVEPGDVLTAVRGVWASAIIASAPGDAHSAGLSASGPPGHQAIAARARPGVQEMAVLIQPEVRPRVSGAARADPGGTVAVTAVRGAPAPLMSGWSRGVTARVMPDGRIDGDRALAQVGREVLTAVAGTVVALQDATGDGVVEWAEAGGSIVLLQCGQSSQPPAAGAADGPPVMPAGSLPVTPAGDLAAISRYSRAYAGPLGDRLVLPWWPAANTIHTAGSAGAAGGSGRGPDVTAARARTAWARAQALADELTGPVPALEAGTAQRLLRSCEAVARYLVRGGWIARERELWLLTTDEVTRLINGSADPPAGPVLDRRERQAVRRWEQPLFAALMSEGRRASGDAAAPGPGAGPVRLADTPPGPVPGAGRYVLVARYPLPRFAPLLWAASALVTSEGSAGAHLIEVARSLGVPAVVGCGEADPGRIEPGNLAAVDGDLGVVAFAPR
jgi:phosphohistidine swiveling domain-containing protein